MIVKSIFNNGESHSHNHWVFRDVNVDFSRLYYVLDGEAYYEEGGRTVRLKKGYLYLTPVRTPFDLYDNQADKLLHTYTHVYTLPTVTEFTEIEVVEGTPLHDAVLLWRRHIHTKDTELLTNVIQFLLSCIDRKLGQENAAARAAKQYLDQSDSLSLDMEGLSRALGYTREHITRSFVAAYRSTPMQYLKTRRMDIALRRLLQGERACTVADVVGYSDASAFSKAFRRHFGLSPEQYLKTLK